MRVAHRRALQQLADLRLAGAAIGAGLEAAADIIDTGRPFADFGRYLILSDAEARCPVSSDIRAFGESTCSANRPVSHDRDTSL